MAQHSNYNTKRVKFEKKLFWKKKLIKLNVCINYDTIRLKWNLLKLHKQYISKDFLSYLKETKLILWHVSGAKII